MRTVLFFAIATLSVGCAESCPRPSVLNSSLWHYQAHISEWGDGLIDPTYPATTSPMNGAHDLVLAWAADQDEAAVTVTIDGQASVGNGRWSSSECGNFSFNTVADYFGEDGSKHAFALYADMQTWNGYLEGVWEVEEVWTQADGVTKGDGSMVVQVFGTL
ncbi:MAG: hypothetical protein H6738_07215 [Alphaproteobacteria bacterium]|nr:hypothetical protein [Alphaproteobacteria bacterium]MCB9696552.1 hypothetical protein [Alphaproteobacteria bacterium]